MSRGHEGWGHIILEASVPIFRVIHRPPPALEQPGPGGAGAGGVDGAGPVLREARIGVRHQGAQARRVAVQAPAPVVVVVAPPPVSEHYSGKQDPLVGVKLTPK